MKSEVEFGEQLLVLPGGLLGVEGRLEAEVPVLVDGLPEEHVDAFEGGHVQAEFVAEQLFDGVQLCPVVYVHVDHLSLVVTGVYLHQILQICLDIVPILIDHFAGKGVHDGRVPQRCLEVDWPWLQGHEVDHVSEPLSKFRLVLAAIDEASLEALLFKECAKYLCGGSSPNDQCVFVLQFDIAPIALFYSEDIGIGPTQLPYCIFIDSIQQSMLYTDVSLFEYALLSLEHGLIRYRDRHPPKAVLLHLPQGKHPSGDGFLVVGFPALEAEEKVMNLWTEGGLYIFANEIILHFCSTIYNESMEQSEYLKNLLKRLDEATEHLEPQDQSHSPYTLSTIRFEREDFDSNVEYSKRDAFANEEINRTVRPRSIKDSLMEQVGQVGEKIDDSKTMRNSPGLKFNPAKSRKKSENKYDREPSKRSCNTKRDKSDLVEVRDKLNDIVAFLNHKIESNPEAEEVKRVIEMRDVSKKEESKEGDKYKERDSVLMLPRYEPVSSNNQKQPQQQRQQEKSKYDNDYLNLKHSFDRLGDIHSSNSLHSPQQPRSVLQNQQQTRHLPIIQAEPQIIYRYPPNPIVPTLSQRPAIMLNGKVLNNNNSRSNISLSPYPQVVRPLSEVPVQRYLAQSPPSINQVNRQYDLNQVPMVNSSYLIPLQHNRTQPQLVNANQPSFRTITTRPLSTQRNQNPPNIIQQRLAGQSPQFPRPTLHIKNLPAPQVPLQGGRLKKKTNTHNHFKEQPISKLSEYIDKEVPQEKQEVRVKEELEKVLPPPRPYTNYSTTNENPFKKTDLSLSKKSSRFKAEISNEILKSIAQQSEENHVTRNLQGSGRSSSRQMSEVNSNIYFSKVNKFQGAGSTKLKRKGIDLSTKQGYMSHYTRN